MKNTLKILGIIALAALIGFTVIGCKKNTPAPVAPVVESAAANSFLAEYEAFVNDASDVMQKILLGDETLAGKAEELGTKADEMIKRWEGLSPSELSPAQTQKFQDLSGKLIKALGL